LTDYLSLATAAAANAGIPASLFSALIDAESGWNPFQPGSSGEFGLTQLMPGTAADLNVDQYDPISNLKGGATYLSQLFDQTGNWYDALRAYNTGPTTAASNPNAGSSYAESILSKATGLTQSQLNMPNVIHSFTTKSLFDYLPNLNPVDPNSILNNVPSSLNPAHYMDQFLAWITQKLAVVAAVLMVLALVWLGLKAITTGANAT
jgi:hypothetical protein